MPEEIIVLQQKIEEQKKVLDAVYASVEKMRRYFLVSAWVTVLFIVLPLVGIMFFAPSFLSTYTSTLAAPSE